MFSRRDTIAVVVLIFLLGGLWLVATSTAGDGGLGLPKLSSFRTSPSGARALYLTLQELNVPTSRRLTPHPVEGSSTGGALALLAPTEPPTPRELARLHDWVRSGGTLLYAASSGDPTLDTLGLELELVAPGSFSPLETSGGEGVPVRTRPHRWTEGLETSATVRFAFTDSSRALSAAGAEPLLVSPSGDVAAVVFRRGEGTVVAWSDGGLLSNRALRAGSRPLVFVRAAAEAAAGGEPVVFDEYHHGYREGGGPVQATLRFARETGPGRAALQIAVAGFGLLLLLGRRFGSPVEVERGRRRSPLEHVEALSAAYQGANARTTARRLLVAGLARRLGRKLPEATSATTFLERLADGLAMGHDETVRLLEDWREGEDADLTELARDVDDVVSAAKRSHRPPATRSEDSHA